MRTEQEERGDAVVLDLDRLEAQAEELYLVRFVRAVKKARGEHGRYLALRAGDRTAIDAADDGSSESLERVIVDPSETKETGA
jgi:hypothetical protein